MTPASWFWPVSPAHELRPVMRYARCVTCHQMVGWIGLLANLGLSGLKLFVGIVAGSQALMVDALYSAKDVATSILILVGLKFSSQPIDREHPFGHGKVEFLLSGLVSLLLLGVTGYFFFNSAEHLMEGDHPAPHLIALWTAVFSIVVNTYMHRYTRCVAAEINSPIVLTLSKHHHADGFSSAAVALGIIGAHYLGLTWLDHAVAIGEVLHLIYLGGEVFWDSFKGLMDESAPREIHNKINAVSAKINGVKKVEQTLTRRVGQEIWIDMVVGVDPDQSVSQARGITRNVETALATLIPHVGNVNVQFKSESGSVPELDYLRKQEATRRAKNAISEPPPTEEPF